MSNELVVYRSWRRTMASHGVPIEQPERINAMLGDFLDGSERQATPREAVEADGIPTSA